MPSPTRGRVVPAKISRTLLRMMDHVVEEVSFYRDRTLVPGYHVGGKTGTAQIWDAKKKAWKHNLFNYSFVGYIAARLAPRIVVVAVRIEEGTAAHRRASVTWRCRSCRSSSSAASPPTRSRRPICSNDRSVAEPIPVTDR